MRLFAAGLTVQLIVALEFVTSLTTTFEIDGGARAS